MYERYCNLRDSRGYKDADVARITGITKSTFTDWKSGKSKPNADKLLLIAKCLETTVEYLMTGKEPNIDFIYSVGNAKLMIEITKRAEDKEFADRMMKYMSLLSEDKKSVDDMIDFLHNKAQKKGD